MFSLTRQQVTSLRIRENRIYMSLQLVCLGCLSILFSRVCHHSNPASVTSHRSWSIPVSTQSEFAVLLRPSSLQSKLRSIKTSASVQEALKQKSLLRDNDFTAKAVRDMIAEVEGRKPRKKKPTPQTRSCTTLCTIPERHPVRRSARERQCTETFRHHHHLSPLRQLVCGADLSWASSRRKG